MWLSAGSKWKAADFRFSVVLMNRPVQPEARPQDTQKVCSQSAAAANEPRARLLVETKIVVNYSVSELWWQAGGLMSADLLSEARQPSKFPLVDSQSQHLQRIGWKKNSLRRDESVNELDRCLIWRRAQHISRPASSHPTRLPLIKTILMSWNYNSVAGGRESRSTSSERTKVCKSVPSGRLKWKWTKCTWFAEFLFEQNCKVEGFLCSSFRAQFGKIASLWK